MEVKLTFNGKMPFGKYNGKRVIDVLFEDIGYFSYLASGRGRTKIKVTQDLQCLIDLYCYAVTYKNDINFNGEVSRQYALIMFWRLVRLIASQSLLTTQTNKLICDSRENIEKLVETFECHKGYFVRNHDVRTSTAKSFFKYNSELISSLIVNIIGALESNPNVRYLYTDLSDDPMETNPFDCAKEALEIAVANYQNQKLNNSRVIYKSWGIW